MIILHVKVYNLILKTLNKKNQKVRILLNKQLSKYLGIDFGINKSGVSISDSNKLISFPLETIETKNLLDYIKQISIDENIEIFFEKIDLFLFLTESEGFGLVVLEAIENNIPVVCSNIEPLSEFVENSYKTLVNRDNTGDIANFVYKILNDDDLIKQIQIKQKNKITKEFPITLSAEKHEKYYINLLNN